MTDGTGPSSELESLRQRVESLERDNQLLRSRLSPMTGVENPWFNAMLFQRVVKTNFAIIFLGGWVSVGIVVGALYLSGLHHVRIGTFPLLDLAGKSSGLSGFGFGVFAFGGAAFGVVATGGMAVGIIAFGGGAIGLIAVGGGSFGLIALGGGAVGYIAIGGSAVGKYALGIQNGVGKYVLSLNRQDPEAVQFFVRYIPGLRRAVTMPMPVLPVRATSEQGQVRGI